MPPTFFFFLKGGGIYNYSDTLVLTGLLSTCGASQAVLEWLRGVWLFTPPAKTPAATQKKSAAA
jgi:hypothetical protein